MTEKIIMAFVTGTALGVFYFLGLWWTVQRLNSPYAGILLPLSFLVRAVIVVAGFYYVMDGLWQALLMALAGFVAARIVIVSRMKRKVWE